MDAGEVVEIKVVFGDDVVARAVLVIDGSVIAKEAVIVGETL